MKLRALQILWPAFLTAGVLEMLVFAVVDPGEMHWFGGMRIDWSAQAVYTFTFLLFWGAISTAGALTALLSVEADVGTRAADQAVAGATGRSEPAPRSGSG